jgi:hypothetical protein
MSDADTSTPQLVAVLPPNAHTEYGDFPPVVRAIDDARQQREHKTKPDVTAGVHVVPDREVHDDVLEVLGKDIQIVIPCRVSLHLLVLHIKDIGKFFDIEISIVDSKAKLRHILLTNRITTVRVSEDSCALPLTAVNGWNHLPINLSKIVHASFSTTYVECTGIVLHASMRVSHVYFEDREYNDSQLPGFLRTIKVPG